MRVGDQGELVKDGIRALEQAALPTGLEWFMWWNEWVRDVEQKDGWERALVDAFTRLQKNQITLARMIRNAGDKAMLRYDSRGYIQGEESKQPDEFTREAFSWFLSQVMPTKKNAPDWAQILFKCAEGCFLQQARLGLELAAIKRKGYLTVNHSATVKNPDSFKDDGTETL